MGLSALHGEKNKLRQVHFSSFQVLSSRKAMKMSIMLYPPSKQRLHRSQFLQKLSRQKPCRDQARLICLVNKQVGSAAPVACAAGLFGTMSNYELIVSCDRFPKLLHVQM